jgi:hypothetical protein
LGGLFPVGFAWVVVAMLTASDLSEYNRYRQYYESGKCQQVEGVVSQLKYWQEQTKSVYAYESFTVNDCAFLYWQCLSPISPSHSPGFNQMNFIVNGMYVRIWYVDIGRRLDGTQNIITRLDLRDTDSGIKKP